MHGNLTIVGGIIIQLSRIEGIHCRHLHQHLSPLTGMFGIGEMAGISTLHVVARLCGNHIEDVGNALLVVNIPL